MKKYETCKIEIILLKSNSVLTESSEYAVNDGYDEQWRVGGNQL